MAGKEKAVHKKPVGRPAGRRFTETLPLRLTPVLTKAVDAWAKRRKLSRSVAIRQLLEHALTAEGEI
jgi:hypothetical protein